MKYIEVCTLVSEESEMNTAVRVVVRTSISSGIKYLKLFAVVKN